MRSACTKPGEVMTPDGVCCDPNNVAECGQCCGDGMVPDPANGTCMPEPKHPVGSDGIGARKASADPKPGLPPNSILVRGSPGIRADLAEAAARCGITQPRINDLLRGRISRFSLDALVNIACALGRKVTVKLEDAA